MARELLDETHPNLIKEWNYAKNGDLKPQNVSFGMKKKVWWICDKGHEWQTSIYARAKGSKCPICLGQKILVGYNDLLTLNPGICKEWNYVRNGNLKPTDIMQGTNKKVWWICKLGHEWQMTVNNRALQKQGCPYCAGKRVLKEFNDFASRFPDLAKEWNYQKNTNLKPEEITAFSNKKVWWICDKGHEWQSTILNRTRANVKCPICQGRKVLAGYNDLITVCPNMLSEWNYKKNDRLGYKPSNFTRGSKTKVWWICDKGHEWKAEINNRVGSKNGCPECSARIQTSFGEQAIYYYLKKRIGYEAFNRYQLSCGLKRKIEIDVYLPNFKIGIEYDGMYWHKGKAMKDIQKEQSLLKLEIKLIRIKESLKNEVIENNILFNCKQNYDENLSWAISRLKEFIYFGDDILIDVEKDALSILELYKKDEYEKSLSRCYPELSLIWNYARNGNMKPNHFTAGSQQKVWWICDKGHEWQCSIAATISKKLGCPICSNRQILRGFNDLETINMKIAKEWNYDMNGSLKPWDVTIGSSKKVWWICDKGHEWKAQINSRTQRLLDCPYCTNRKVLKGYNDIGTTHPKLLEEWNFPKNNAAGYKPYDFTYGNASKKVWWICRKGHEWEEFIAVRTNMKTGCPYCAGRRVFKGFNDLCTLFPTLVKEWNYEKNGDLLPENYTKGSHKKVWWKCQKGHEWEAQIKSRTGMKSGCPYCSGRMKINQ